LRKSHLRQSDCRQGGPTKRKEVFPLHFHSKYHRVQNREAQCRHQGGRREFRVLSSLFIELARSYPQFTLLFYPLSRYSAM
jgi:hypothetical protein